MNETQDRPQVSDLFPFLSLADVSQQERDIIGRAIGNTPADEIMPLSPLQLTNRIEQAMTPEDKHSSSFSLGRFRIGEIAVALLHCANKMLGSLAQGQQLPTPVQLTPYDQMSLNDLLEALVARPTMVNRILPHIETLIPEAILKTQGRWVVPEVLTRDGVNINVIATAEYAHNCNRYFRSTSPRVKTSNGVMIPITLDEALGENVRPLAHPYFKSPIEGVDEEGYDISGMDATFLEIIAWAYLTKHPHYPQTQDYFDFMEEITCEAKGEERSRRWARITLDYEAAKVREGVPENMRFRTSRDESYVRRQRSLTGRPLGGDHDRAVYGGDHLDFRGVYVPPGATFVGKQVNRRDPR